MRCGRCRGRRCSHRIGRGACHACRGCGCRVDVPAQESDCTDGRAPIESSRLRGVGIPSAVAGHVRQGHTRPNIRHAVTLDFSDGPTGEMVSPRHKLTKHFSMRGRTHEGQHIASVLDSDRVEVATVVQSCGQVIGPMLILVSPFPSCPCIHHVVHAPGPQVRSVSTDTPYPGS